MTASRLYIEELETALKDLKTLIRGKFEKKEIIFDFVWKSLEKDSNTLEGLDSYYTLTIKGLKIKIDQFVKDKRLDLKKLNFTDNDFLILEKTLAVRHILARQQFICTQLNTFDWERLTHDLNSLLFECSNIIETFDELDLPTKKIFLQQLDEVTYKIAFSLQQKKILDDNEKNYNQPNSLSMSKTPEIILILENLIYMPSLIEINEDNWKDTVEELGTCHATIEQALIKLFNAYEKMAKSLEAINARIQNKTNDIAVKKEINDYYTWLIKFNYDNNNTERGSTDLEEAVNNLTIACKDSNVLKGIGFAGTSDKLHDRFVSIRNNLSLINKFKEFYTNHLKFITDVVELTDRNNVLTEKQALGKIAINDIQNKLKSSRNLWNNCSDAVVTTYKELHKKFAPNLHPSFVKRHWWKIGIGAVLGAAVAGVVGYFLLPALALTVMSIVSFALCISVGLLIGGAIATGIAKIVDICSPKNTVVIPMATHRPDFNNFDLSDDSSEEATPTPEVTESLTESFNMPPASAPIPIPKPKLTVPANNYPQSELGVSWVNPFTWFGKGGVPTNAPATLEEDKRNTL